MTCPKTCARPGCERPARKRERGPGHSLYCSGTCAQAASVTRRAALQRSRTTAPREGQDEGPDVPLNGWTAAMARERRDRIAAEMLRDGWPPSALFERFPDLDSNLGRLRRRFRIPTPTPDGLRLPGGMPVR